MDTNINTQIEKIDSWLKKGEDIKASLLKIAETEKTKKEIDVFSITTLKQLYEVSGIAPLIQRSEETIDEFANRKWKVIKKFFNGDWIEDWENGNQKKYLPYYKKDVSGVFRCRTWTYFYG